MPGSAFASELAVLPVVVFWKDPGRGGSSVPSALHVWEEKALWEGSLMENLLWTDPNTSLMVGEYDLIFGSPCRCEQNIIKC